MFCVYSLFIAHVCSEGLDSPVIESIIVDRTRILVQVTLSIFCMLHQVPFIDINSKYFIKSESRSSVEVLSRCSESLGDFRAL